jgi:hypothetical protein
MGKLGIGYGSEWHLLWYLARHRHALDNAVRAATGADRVEWLDFPVRPAGSAPTDAEWKGLDFLTDADTLTAWRGYWPQGAGVHNWDAVGQVRIGTRTEWLLVEAKANCQEIQSDCGAKPTGGLSRIEESLDATKAALGVDLECDWLRAYYQFCNRLAVLHFLNARQVPAHFLTVYFTGDANGNLSCPRDADGWRLALSAQDQHVGLPQAHALQARIHKAFLPAFANVRQPAHDQP